MKKKLFLHISLLIGLVLFIAVLKFVGLDNLMQIFRNIEPTYLIFYVTLSAFIFLGYVYRWYRILKAHGYKVSFRKLFFYRTAGYAVSYITPSAKLGGEPLRTYLLCKDGVEFKDSLSSVVLDKAIELTANGLFTVVGIFYIFTSFAIPENAKWVLYLILLFWVVFIFGFYVRALRGSPTLTLWLSVPGLRKIKIIKKYKNTIKEGEARIQEFFKQNKQEFFIALIISISLWLMMLLEFKLLFMLFGYGNLTLTQIFLVSLLIGVSYAIPVPAALGVLEAGQASLFKILINASGVGFAIGLITRFRDLLWTTIGLLFLYIKGINFIGNKKFFNKRSKTSK